MKIKQNETGMLELTTTAYQSKKGAIVLNWGNDHIVLNKDKADKIARDIKDFDEELYDNFYFPID